MKRTFSAKDRAKTLEEMAERRLDLLIIGGGITGAGIAWDASKRGMVTGLVEMNDFAHGTSSRSTKLIHGGLRYLKQFEFRLVREVGRERELLYRHAPHIVIPARMLLPIYKGGTFGKFSTMLGLYVYDRLAGVAKSERRIMYGREETLRLEPMLKQDGLLGSGVYYEYRTDDARLTLEVLKTARRHGALIVNYTEATGFLYRNGRVSGIRAVDRMTGEEYEIYAKKIVNATGPWVDWVRAKDHAIKGKRLLLTKGVHLVVDHARLPVKQSAYFDVPDGRMIFVIPRDDKTYIGTTDTVYEGDLERPRTSEADVEYLLNAVNATFPNARLTFGDVESMWSGLRPLIREEGKKPSEISRKDELFISSSGLLTIAGGKLTGFRKMAEKVVSRVADELQREEGLTFGPCTTGRETLSGGDSGRSETFAEYREELARHGLKLGLTQKTVEYLLSLYGSNTAEIYLRMEGKADTGQLLQDLRKGIGRPDRGGRAADERDDETEKPVESAEREPLEAEEAKRPDDGPAEPAEPAAAGVEREPDEFKQASLTADGGDEAANAAASAQPLSPLEIVFGHEPTPEERVLAAEVAYCIEEEMAATAADFLVRRTGLLYFNRPQAERIAADVLELMGAHFGWSEAEFDRQRLQLAREWENVTVPKD